MSKSLKRTATPHSDDFLFDLVDTAIETNGGYFFAVPKVISQDRMILAAPDIITQLTGTEWQIEFANERFEIIEFKTAMCFLWVMDDVRRQIRRYQEAVEQGDCTLQFKIHVEVNDGEVMQPVVVRQLLNGLMKKE